MQRMLTAFPMHNTLPKLLPFEEWLANQNLGQSYQLGLEFLRGQMLQKLVRYSEIHKFLK